jgi:hypothetical protein
MRHSYVASALCEKPPQHWFFPKQDSDFVTSSYHRADSLGHPSSACYSYRNLKIHLTEAQNARPIAGRCSIHGVSFVVAISRTGRFSRIAPP